MMKKLITVLALVGVAFSAPQPRKLFHEHVEDFQDIISDESGQELTDLLDQYLEYEEFLATLEFMTTDRFQNLVLEMEHLPEFEAVLDFMERVNIDIHYFTDGFFEQFHEVPKRARQAQTPSGRDFTAYMRDSITLYPKEKLAALFEEKMAEDEEFRTSIENLQSEEWNEIYAALWDSPVFQAEVVAFAENGFDMAVFFEQIVAMFGQN